VLEGTYWSEVSYASEPHSVATELPDVAEATYQLSALLHRVALFARAHKLDYWAEQFELALKRATKSKPNLHPFPDLLPSRHPDSAQRLLAMAMGAWVFGGMGSWNDVSGRHDEGAKTYEALTSALYAAVIDACVAAANAEADH
jgi:hypothetical protein